MEVNKNIDEEEGWLEQIEEIGRRKPCNHKTQEGWKNWVNNKEKKSTFDAQVGHKELQRRILPLFL